MMMSAEETVIQVVLYCGAIQVVLCTLFLIWWFSRIFISGDGDEYE